MRKIYHFILISLAMISIAQAQTNLIKGRVLDKNNFPLPGAVIQIEESNDVTVSDFNGYFSLMTEAASVNLQITYMGFESLEEVLEFPLDASQTKVFVLTPSVNELSEVVVSGFQSGIVKAMNKQKNDVNVTNIVSSDQTGKFPDSNIGDAIKRIPGVMMQNDQGEARDIVIRGISPALNSVTINGDRMPSAEGDNRRIQMDLIPTDMIQMIEVNKTVTPDMEGDAIGGSVNLVTRSNPNAFRFVAN
ncbi:MAG: TonB-dependent receptor, partial [Flavobacteriaceae bacterium TMED42]